MHEDIVVSNGVWKFVGNPEVACKCLHSHKCTQFPEKKIDATPFVQLKDSATKLCVRVWKFHPNKPKFQIGDKVVQTVYQENDTVMRTTGTIEFVENDETPDGFLYWMHLEERSWFQNGKVVSKSKMSGSGAVLESELEKVS